MSLRESRKTMPYRMNTRVLISILLIFNCLFLYQTVVAAPQSSESRGDDKQKHYTGQKISLEFKGINIRDLLAILESMSGKKFVVSDSVTGKITVKCHNAPWDKVLDIVLAKKEYMVIKKENALHIVPFAGGESQKPGPKKKRPDRPLDLVYFYDDTSLEGEILKITPSILKIKTSDGKVHTRKFSEVKRIFEAKHKSKKKRKVKRKDTQKTEALGQNRFYIGLNWIHAISNIDEQQTKDKFSGDIPVDFDDSTGFGLRGGYAFNHRLSLEGILESLTAFSTDLGPDNSSDLKVLTLTLNGKGTLPITKRYLSYALIGVGFLNAYEDISFNGADSQTNDLGFAIRCGLGLEVTVTPVVSLGIEFGFVSGTGSASHVQYTPLTIGVSYHF